MPPALLLQAIIVNEPHPPVKAERTVLKVVCPGQVPQVSTVTGPVQTGVYLNQTSGELTEFAQTGIPVEGVAHKVVPQ